MTLIPSKDNIDEISFLVEDGVQTRLDQYLSGKYTDYSRVFFQKLIKQGLVLVDDKKVKASSKIQTGQKIFISLPQLEPLKLKPENIPLDIIYEDEDLAAVNKDVGLIVHPSKGNLDGTLANGLLYHFRQLSDCTDVYRPGIVHRLDSNTSGVILVAKNNVAHYHISKQFEQRRVQKEYLALVEGNVRANDGEINLPIGMDTRKRERMAIVHGGKPSMTSFRVIARYPSATLVHVFPKTGRTHQIRIHFKSQGHPLVGDYLYGASRTLSMKDFFSAEEKDVPSGLDVGVIERQALHAFRITIYQPKQEDKQICISAALKEDFSQLLEKLNKYWPSPKVEEILHTRNSFLNLG